MTKTAYLTIDDGPTKDMKQKVDYLVSKKIPAIWFCIGSYLEQQPEAAIYAIKKGHILGNHTYSHTNCDKVGLRECYKDILKCDSVIEEIYKKAGVARPVKYFRFPHGRCGGIRYNDKFMPTSKKGVLNKQRLQEFLEKLSYTVPALPKINYQWYKELFTERKDWYWTYDVREYAIFSQKYSEKWNIRDINRVLERMDEENLQYYNNRDFKGLNSDSAEIILLHDQEKTTVYFERIIEKLLAKGLKFVLPL